ncbi:MAG: fused MFS/spermidine synthase [Planctomycetota bacterium]
MSGSPVPSGPGRAVVAAVALLAGFAIMSLELTAVRLMAPHFGDSAFVWTNVIGVILVALAGGAWVGGRLAHARRGGARLGVVFAVAGVWTGFIPLASGPLGSWLLPQTLPLDAALPALVRGSLAATLVLFAPAVALLGCMTPMLVVSLATRDGKVGPASGMIAAVSTLGSLLGTFLTTHVLVPELGSRMTIWCCAAALLLCSAALAGSARRAALLLLPGALAIVDWGPLRAPGPGRELLAEAESAYQYLQVVAEEVDGARTVSLKINEGLDSFHSIKVEGSALTGGRYYDYHAIAPLLAGDGQAPPGLRALSLGAAAGTIGRVLAAAHPGCTVDGVELDPEVVGLGDAFFGERAPGAVYAGLDARVFVERCKERYHVVVVDCYERQIYIPAHVSSREFFVAVERILEPRGVVSVNCGGLSFDDPVVQAIGGTMAAVFGDAHALQIPLSRNLVLVARHGASMTPAATLRRALGASDAPLYDVLSAAAAPQAWRRLTPRQTPLDDDHPFLDQLQDRALTAAPALAASPVPMRGDVLPADAEARATERRQQHDLEGSLAALREAREPTGRLRLLAGDVRWLQRDLTGAQVEYDAALALGDAGLEPFVVDRLRNLEPEIDAARAAHDVAVRNAWVAAAAGALLLVALLLASSRSRNAVGDEDLALR